MNSLTRKLLSTLCSVDSTYAAESNVVRSWRVFQDSPRPFGEPLETLSDISQTPLSLLDQQIRYRMARLGFAKKAIYQFMNELYQKLAMLGDRWNRFHLPRRLLADLDIVSSTTVDASVRMKAFGLGASILSFILLFASQFYIPTCTIPFMAALRAFIIGVIVAIAQDFQIRMAIALAAVYFFFDVLYFFVRVYFDSSIRGPRDLVNIEPVREIQLRRMDSISLWNDWQHLFEICNETDNPSEVQCSVCLLNEPPLTEADRDMDARLASRRLMYQQCGHKGHYYCLLKCLLEDETSQGPRCHICRLPLDPNP